MSGTRSLVRAEIARITQRFEAADLRQKKARAMLPLHDPDVCGLDYPGETPPCPGCRADRSAIRAAEEENREASAEFWAVGSDLADLFLMLLRYAAEHRPEQLCRALAGGMGAELGPMAQAIADLEKRR